jgi:hypothetical protein
MLEKDRVSEPADRVTLDDRDFFVRHQRRVREAEPSPCVIGTAATSPVGLITSDNH